MADSNKSETKPKPITTAVALWPGNTVMPGKTEAELHAEYEAEEEARRKRLAFIMDKRVRVPALGEEGYGHTKELFRVQGRDSILVELDSGRQTMCLPEDLRLINVNGPPAEPSETAGRGGALAGIAGRAEDLLDNLKALNAAVDSTVHLDTYLSGPAVALRAATGLLADAAAGLTLIARQAQEAAQEGPQDAPGA